MAAAVAFVRRSCAISFFLFRYNNSSPFFCSYNNLYFSTKTPSANITAAPTLVFNEDYFVSKYKFSPQIASKLVSASARMNKPQNADLVLSFLKQTGFSHAHLERIVRHYPKVLSSSPEKIVKPKLKIFQDLGFSAADATHLIGHNPNILHYKPKRIIHSLDVYRGLLGSNDSVIELIKKNGSLLYADPEKTVLPNIQFLKTCGVQLDQINSCIYSYIKLFLLSPENMRRCIHKVDDMGVERTSKMFIHAVEAVSHMSDETLKLRLKSLQDLGFSEDHILRLFRTAPKVMALSTQKIKERIVVLLETGKYDMPCIINNPTSLTYSVEKRYKPRIQVLKELERKGLINKWPFLSVLCRMTDKSFFEKFVAPKINKVGEEFTLMMSASRKLETATGLTPSSDDM